MPFQRCAGRGCAPSVSRDLSEKRILSFGKLLCFCARILRGGCLAAWEAGAIGLRGWCTTAMLKAGGESSRGGGKVLILYLSKTFPSNQFDTCRSSKL